MQLASRMCCKLDDVIFFTCSTMKSVQLCVFYFFSGDFSDVEFYVHSVVFSISDVF
jgi:hypothetical protein